MIFLSLLLGFTSVWASEELPQAFTLDGRLFSSVSGQTPLLDTGTFKIQILDYNGTCVLYEESQAFDTRGSAGYFNINIGEKSSATTKRTSGDSGNTLTQVFSNSGGTIPGKLLSNGAACTGSGAVGNTRSVQITVIPDSDPTPKIMTMFNLNSVPSAFVAERAESLEGIKSSGFLQVRSTAPYSLSQANLENIFSTTNYSKLVDILNGSTNLYVHSGSNGAIQAPSIAGTPSSPAAGQIWYDSGVVKYYDGTSTQTLSAGSGITSLIIGSGLTPTGTISTGGQTIAVDTGVTAGKIVQVQTGGKLPALDGSDLTNVTATAFSSTGSISTSGSVSANAANFRALTLTNAGTQTITLNPAASITGSPISFTLPAAMPASNGYVLSSTTAGVMSWVAPATGGLAAVSNTASLANGKTWIGDAGGVAQEKFIGMADIRSSQAGNAQFFPASACSAGQTLSWQSGTDTLVCSNISLSASQVSGVVLNGGQAGAVTAGTDDATALTLETNNTARITIDSAGQVGIGTATPALDLDVYGQIALSGERTIAAFGDSLVVGKTALPGTAGFNNTAFGSHTLTNTSGNSNTAVGAWVLTANTTGSGNSGFGQNALMSATTGSDNTGLGNRALRQLVTGGQNTAVGSQAGQNTVLEGWQKNITNSNSTYLGYNAMPYQDGGTNEIVIGHTAQGLGSNTVVLGNNSIVTTALKGNVGIGTSTPGDKLHVEGKIRGTHICATDGTNCKDLTTAWTGGGGTVTSVAAGTGLTGGTITGSGTIGLGTELAGLNGLATTGFVKRTGAGTYTTATSLSLTSDITGVLPVANGGTNSSTTLNNNRLMVSSGGAIVEASAMTDGQFVVGKTGAAPQLVTMSGDATVSNTGAMTVTGLRGTSVSATAPSTTGQMLRYNGSAWAPGFVGMQDLRSNVTGTPALGTSCTAAQTITYDSVGDTLTCANISISASQITSGAAGAFVLNGGQAGAVTAGPSDANALTLQTNGAARVTIDSSGNVGVGTTSPAALMHVRGAGPAILNVQSTGANNSRLTIDNAAGSNQSSIHFQDAGTSKWEFGKHSNNSFFIYDNANSKNILSTSGTNLALQPTSGNVGIGTTSPTEILSVQKDQAAGTSIQVKNGTADAAAWSGYKVVNDIGGIGYLWTGSSAYTSSALRSRLIVESDSTNGLGVDLVAAKSTGDIRFQTGGYNERMRIDSSGNVGIGTTAPNQLLTVEGPMSLRAQAAPSLTANYGKLYVDSGDANKLKYMNPAGSVTDLTAGGAAPAGSDGNIQFKSGSSLAASSNLHWDGGSSYLGIGTSSPSERLTVVRSPNVSNGEIAVARFTDSSDGVGLRLGWRGDGSTATGGSVRSVNNKPLFLGTSTAPQAITVADNGRVDIGTNNPSSALHVNGTITATGFVGPLSASSTATTGGFTINTDSDNSGSDGGVNFQTNGSNVAKFTATGLLQAGSGAIGTPGLSFLNDPDTGLYSSGTNTASIAAGGVEGLRVNTIASGVNYVAITPAAAGSAPTISSAGADTNINLLLAPKGTGKVGIGTTSPASALEVGSTDPWPAITVKTADTTQYSNAGLVLLNNAPAAENRKVSMFLENQVAGGGGVGWFAIRHNDYSGTSDLDLLGYTLDGTNSSLYLNAPKQMEFSTNGSTRMTMTNDGKIGIGTTSPYDVVDIRKPDVSMSVRGSNTANMYLMNSLAGNTAPEFSIMKGGATGLAANGDALGYLNFGSFTSTWGYKNLSRIAATLTATPTDTSMPSDMRFFTTSTGSTAGTERMRITDDGKVGIGVTTPDSKLTVRDSDASTTIKVGNNNSTAIRYPSVQVYNYQGTGSGVGGYPTLQLYNYRDNAGGATAAAQTGDVLGSIIFGGATGTGHAVSWNEAIKVKAAENYTSGAYGSEMHLQTTAVGASSATARVSILADGKVGIGTTSPATKLQVNGAIGSVAVSDSTPTSFDMSLGNVQYTSTACSGATWTLNNMVDGTMYTIGVQPGSAHTGACVFSDGSSTFKYQPANIAPAGSTHAIYSIVKIGSFVYVSWIGGF